MAPLGLTSARWQVLGTVAEAGGGLPTAGIARNMGLTRQSVQRVVDDLARGGLVRFAPNPGHKRAKLVQLTDAGACAFAAASALWRPRADALLAGASVAAVEAAVAVLRGARLALQDPSGDTP